jgi:DNA protecting protein DprA
MQTLIIFSVDFCRSFSCTLLLYVDVSLHLVINIVLLFHEIIISMDTIQTLAVALGLAKLRTPLRLSNRLLVELLENGLPDLIWTKRKKADGTLQIVSDALYRLKCSLMHEAKRLAQKRIFAVFPTGFLSERLLTVDPPVPFLFARGEGSLKALISRYTAAVIGSRNPSAYGVEVTKKIASELVSISVTVVSGGARGIDSIAHEAALVAGGMTIAVLGQGVDIVYPRENAALFDRIAETGLLLSEYAPGTRPRPYHFPTRNRIVAGLSDAVIVTEAKADSGTLITAGFAADQGKDVYAVPGSIFSSGSESCHRLISEGAGLIASAFDIAWS